jgi:hypothetical protein
MEDLEEKRREKNMRARQLYHERYREKRIEKYHKYKMDHAFVEYFYAQWTIKVYRILLSRINKYTNEPDILEMIHEGFSIIDWAEKKISKQRTYYAIRKIVRKMLDSLQKYSVQWFLFHQYKEYIFDEEDCEDTRIYDGINTLSINEFWFGKTKSMKFFFVDEEKFTDLYKYGVTFQIGNIRSTLEKEISAERINTRMR